MARIAVALCIGFNFIPFINCKACSQFHCAAQFNAVTNYNFTITNVINPVNLDNRNWSHNFIRQEKAQLINNALCVAVVPYLFTIGYFAFASAPDEAELEVLVKQKVGASKVIFDMHEGEMIELVGIAGHGFSLSEQKQRDLVFVAMGTGVAPLRSALRHVLRHKEDFGQLVVLYGARTPDDFCYRDEVDEWAEAGVELRQVISRPEDHDWSGPTGYVQSLLDHVLPDLTSPVALVCGSLQMINETRERLTRMGFASDDILTNY